MCLIVFAWNPGGAQRLVVAANRDEFHARPAAPATFWDDAPQVLAGRDLQARGTWLGVTRAGRFAAVTNVRDPQPGTGMPAPRSRGDLTREFLEGRQSPAQFAAALARGNADFDGFNLLIADDSELWYVHGGRRSHSHAQPLAAGVFGLSNASLDVPWPKVRRARARLEALLPRLPHADHDALAQCVADRRLASEKELAGQGLEGEMARRLSAQFIVTPRYGTRCTTTLQIDGRGSGSFRELRFDAAGRESGRSEFRL
jgi:uncharacterized protein with NRDE domain